MPARSDDSRAAVAVTAIYGGNASGKSSLLDGLRFMREAVLESFARWDVDDQVPREPFRLSPEMAKEPSLFAVQIVVDDVQYTYGFTLNDDEVLEEWLYSYPKKRMRVLFEREGDELTFGSTVSKEVRSTLSVLDLSRPNALFLSACGQAGLEPFVPVYRWFRQKLRMRQWGQGVYPRAIQEQVSRLLRRNPAIVNQFMHLLVSADVGITGLEVEEPTQADPRDTIQVLDKQIVDLEGKLSRAKTPASQKKLGKELESAHARRQAIIRIMMERRALLKFLHGTDDPFRFEQESAGTQAWLGLLPLVLLALEGGHTVVVDEIDTSLHPLLTAQLVGLFHGEDTNPNGAQLIFTTHDVSLLGNLPTGHLDGVLGGQRMGKVLNREEVWFVEKNSSGASKLYPLSDFKPREGNSTERRYLRGSYGAVPVLDPQDFADAVLER